MRLKKWSKKIFLCLSMVTAVATPMPSLSAPLEKVNDLQTTPVLAGISELGRLPWGYWFEEYLPLPNACTGEELDECGFSRIFLVPDKLDYDETEHPAFVTPHAFRWVVLGYSGRLEYLEGGEPLKIKLLKINTTAKARYEACEATLGSESGRLNCEPLTVGTVKKDQVELPGIELDLASFTHLDRLALLNNFDPSLAIYRRSIIQIGEKGKSDSYSSAIVFILNDGGKAKAYRTPAGENWSLGEFLTAPNKYDRIEHYKFNLIKTSGDFQKHAVCVVKIDMSGAVLEECADLQFPHDGKAEQVKGDPETGRAGNPAPEGGDSRR